MQTKLILTKDSDSTVRVYILNEADEAFSLANFVSAKFTVKSSIDGLVLIEKSGTTITTTTTLEPGLSIHSNYIEINISSSDTTDLDPGTYIADVVFENSAGKEFITDLFYVELKSRISE